MAVGAKSLAYQQIRMLEADLDRADRLVGAYDGRVLSPTGTVAKLRPLFAELGITRLGLLTGLDVIGIPVAFATRPNSFTLSVFQGKGLDVDTSMASASMEAFETRIAELPLARCARVFGLSRETIGRRAPRADLHGKHFCREGWLRRMPASASAPLADARMRTQHS